MGSYYGPAVAVADGQEYECTAQLRSRTAETSATSFGGRSDLRGLPSWEGKIEFKDGDSAWVVKEANNTRLRISRESGFVVTGAGSLTLLVIEGSAPVPFD